MNNNLREYIDSFDNIIWLYRDIIDDNISKNENLKNIDNESKKELFDYIFNKYLDSESDLNSLSIDARYYGFFRLKDIKIFSPIEEYCNSKIRNEISKIKISNVRNIFMHLDMVIFLDDSNLLNEIPFSEYLSFICDRIKDINYGNGYYYAKSMSLIFIIKLSFGDIKEKANIDEILNAIKKFDELGQYNILEYIIYSLTIEEIQSDLIYDNLIKYCIELFNEEKLIKGFYGKKIIKTLYTIINSISDNNERLKYILEIYFTKDEKALEEIYKYINFEQKYKLDIPIYCLFHLTKNKVDIKTILTDAQYRLIIMYLALYVEKDNKIIIKNAVGENIDLSIYWDLIRNQFLEYCNNYDIKRHGLFFLDRYRNFLEVLNPTKEEFIKFSEHSKIFFYWYIIKVDNKELYSLIPEDVKKAIEINKRYREKIEKEKLLFQKERIECVHKFFDKNKIIEDIDNIIKVLGNNPTFQDLSFYNGESYKDKYENKEKYLEETERVIINPFIIDYYLIISRIFVKYVFMDKIKEYVNYYWDKHWGIQLYNYLKRHSDIIDKVNFSEEEKNKIKDYFKSSNYSKNIKDLHNCLEGTFGNSYLYFIFYNLGNVFKDIEFEYDEEILINMLKIPYYNYKGDTKLYNNYYYLEYFGIIMEYDADNIGFDRFFIGNEEMKTSILKKLIENIGKDKIANESGSYYTLLSIIKLYNSDKENYQQYYDNIAELVVHFYILSLNKVEFSQIYSIINNFIQENNLDLRILDIINKSNQVNYDHLKYINNLQKKLLEKEKLYDTNDYYYNCYKLIYEIRIKINSKKMKITNNLNSNVIDTIKNEIKKFEKYNNINYLEQSDFNNFKKELKSIYDKFIKESDFNSEEIRYYENILYLQSFIIEDITIWQKFTEFLINNKDHYYNDMIIEKLVFENLFEQIDKDNFNFDFFIDNLILLYNNTIGKTYETGIIPNENLILWLLNTIISYLIELKLEEDLYKKIHKGIPFLDGNIKEEIRRKVFNEFSPVKIEIKNNNYIVYNLKDDYNPIYKTENIDELVKWLVPNDDNEVSRILPFDYLLKDIKNKTITISSPKNFEDPNENLYNSEDKIYIICFSRTIDEDNAYAWWKIYGQIPNDKNDKFENIKIRINFNKRNLIKNLLKSKNSDYIYYFGDIDYSMPKDNNKANIEIKDFFYKSYAFKFEDEFRVLIKCKNSNDKNIIYNNKNEPYLLKLPVNNNLYNNRSMKISKNFFNPYKHIRKNTKIKIKDILIAYKKSNIRKTKKHIKELYYKFIMVRRRYIKNKNWS